MRSPMQAVLAALRWLMPRKPPDDDTPEKRFEKVHGLVFATGIAPVGGTAALCIVNAFAVLIDAGSIEWPPLLVGLVILTPPGGFLIWVGVALKRKRPLARKAAAFLCAAGITAPVAVFAWFWIQASRMYLVEFGLLGTYRSVGVSPPMPWYALYCLFGFMTIVMGILCAAFGWKLFKAYEYLTSDEVRRICGELPEAPGGGSP